nr:adenylate kinase 5, chloroplastic isoform X1 [Ipomoea batatas]
MNEKSLKVKCSQRESLKVMISGAPASGKGTQCEMISQKFGLVHISTGDLLRAEVSAGTDIGNKAKEYMNSGRLVPDEIVTSMVTARLSLKDAKEKGWLLDGYPRSLAQAKSLEKLKIRPDVYIMLDVQRILLFASIVLDLLQKDYLFIQVPDEILIDRCVGRRLDPLTGRIYHEKNFPPETEEIKARLVTRPDDTEEKVKARLQIYKQNSEAVLPIYLDILRKVNGNRMKEVVFNEIDLLLSHVLNEKEKAAKSELSTKTTTSQANMVSSSKVYADLVALLVPQLLGYTA